MHKVEFSIIESSLGNIVLVARNKKLTELDIVKNDFYTIEKLVLRKYPDALESSESFNTIHTMLDRYLKGERVDFQIEVDLSEETVFTKRVLMEVKKIPYGEVRTYEGIGKSLGYSKAPRAVGQAVKQNPIPIIIPCHRVIRKDGTIGSFSMGIELKRKLLALEGIKFSE